MTRCLCDLLVLGWYDAFPVEVVVKDEHDRECDETCDNCFPCVDPQCENL
jgi:hypothetical protein